jgi:hypothetical protein
MRLFLTTASPSNAIYTDASGAPQYKVKTPFKVHNSSSAEFRADTQPRRQKGMKQKQKKKRAICQPCQY